MLAGLRVAARAPRLRAARLLSSGSHSDFETVRAAVPDTPAGVKAMIQEQVDGNTVMLYMKGTPARPQCGFSQQVCRILHATGVEFASLYVGGEFVGGCDIVTESFQSGELDEAFWYAGAK
ncbi:protein disulfide oxidoreductase [Aureococcus anophagefferens]|nr:protein disulfide oxidoreductase [Aureococcus anophagefferens]